MSWLEKYRKLATLFLLVIIVAGGATFFLHHNKDTSVQSIKITPSPPPQIQIHIVGEVLNPGIYTLEWESRVNDAVEIAGGFTPDADREAINLARKLRDGEQVRIYKRGEVPQKININTADPWLLQSLSGIGPALSQRIVEYREEKGPFQKTEDLRKVNGIGSKVYEKIEDKITV